MPHMKQPLPSCAYANAIHSSNYSTQTTNFASDYLHSKITNIKCKMTTIEMRVHMDCVGCESRVKSALQKMRGVDEVEIDMVQQKVTVTGYADQKKVLKKVRKTGRRAELWQLPFNPDHSSLLGGGSNSTNGGYFYNPHGCNGPINHHAPVPGSSYNYYKHGYDSNDYSSYQHHPVHASIFSHQAGSKFSDENPNAACSIM
ncbi:hypothetical protein Bca4012_097184 [Brassica carinata]